MFPFREFPKHYYWFLSVVYNVGQIELVLGVLWLTVVIFLSWQAAHIPKEGMKSKNEGKSLYMCSVHKCWSVYDMKNVLEMRLRVQHHLEDVYVMTFSRRRLNCEWFYPSSEAGNRPTVHSPSNTVCLLFSFVTQHSLYLISLMSLT